MENLGALILGIIDILVALGLLIWGVVAGILKVIKMEKKVIQKVTALFLIFIIAFVTVGCNINSTNNTNSGWTNPSLSDPDEDRITEDTDIEDTLNEFVMVLILNNIIVRLILSIHCLTGIINCWNMILVIGTLQLSNQTILRMG